MRANEALAEAHVGENLDHALTDEVAAHRVEVVPAYHAKRRPQREHRGPSLPPGMFAVALRALDLLLNHAPPSARQPRWSR